MTLLSKSFLVKKGDNLKDASQFLFEQIGYDAYLLKEIKAESLNDEVTNVTFLYYKNSEQILDNISPRKGGIYTQNIAGSNYYSQILFSQKLDPNTLVSGSVVVDGTGIAAGRLSIPTDSNDHILLVNLSGLTNKDFHEIRIDRDKLTLSDGSLFSYSPVAGYVIHTYPSAHLGDYSAPYKNRIRGKVKVDVVRTNKGVNLQKLLLENLNTARIDPSNLLYFTYTTSAKNFIDIFYAYVENPEPIILDSYPLNNSLLPNGAPPDRATFVFNTELDRSSLLSNTFFKIRSGYSSEQNIDVNYISLLSDDRTVVINTTGYINSQGSYVITVGTGLPSYKGFKKEKPEQWNIYVDSYLSVSATGTGVVEVQELGGLNKDGDDKLGITLGPGFTLPTVPGEGIRINVGSGITPINTPGQSFGVLLDNNTLSFNSATGIQVAQSGLSGIHIRSGQVVKSLNSLYDNITLQGIGSVNISVAGNTITISGSATGTSSAPDLSDEPFIVTEAPTALNNYYILTPGSGITLVNDSFTSTLYVTDYGGITGHTGDSSIHFTQASIVITSSQISNFDTSVNNLISPLSGLFTGHTGDSTIHFTQSQISIPSTQISDFTEASQDIIGALLQDTSTINFTYNDGAGTLQTDVIPGGVDHNSLLNYVANQHINHANVSITGFSGLTGGGNLTSSTGIWLTNTTVTPGTYGSATQVSVITVDQQGRLTSASTTSINLTASSISDFSEAVDDRVGSLISGQSGIVTTYIDASNLLTIGFSGTFYSDITGHLSNTSNPHSVTAPQIGAATLADFTGYTGSVGDLSRYVFRDGSRGFTGTVSGITPTSANHLATKSYVDSVISPAPVLENFIQFSTTAGESGIYTLSGGLGIDLYTGLSGYVVINNTGAGLAVDYRELTGNIIPNTSGSYNIGSTAKTVSSIYADNLYLKNNVEANTYKLANSQWIQGRNSGDTAWVNIIRVNSLDEVEINSSVFSGISFSELMFEAGEVPDTPVTDAFKIYAYTTGTTPNKEIVLYALDKSGVSIVLTSMIE